MSDYATMQARFAAALTDRTHAEEATELFIGDPGRVSKRLALYRGNVQANTAKSLAAAYPVTAKIVGDTFFQGLAHAYLRTHPSASGDLNEYGAQFAEFLSGFEPVRELAYLPDVARMEWLAHRAHYAADYPALDARLLAEIPEAQQPNLRLHLHPACAVLGSAYPLARIWDIHQEAYQGGFDVDFDSGPHYILVSRPHFRVSVTAIDAGTHAFLEAVGAGAVILSALERALEAAPDFALGPALAAAVKERVIVDCSVEQ